MRRGRSRIYAFRSPWRPAERGTNPARRVGEDPRAKGTAERAKRAARIWAENAILLTSETWSYVKVPQGGFGQLQPDLLSDLWHLR